MKTSKIKSAILNGSVIERNAWSISIGADDQVLIFPPKGAGFKTSLGNIDQAVSDFCKRAEMPIPGVNQTNPPKDTSSTDMGSDSSVGEGFRDPSINKHDKPDGKKSPTDLGKDTSTDEGFKNPSVIKRQPVNKETGGLPDTDLGSDTSMREPDFRDKSVSIQSDGRTSYKIQDTFAIEKTPDFYKKHKAPSAKLLEDIMDPEAWAANNRQVVSQYLNDTDPDRDMSNPHRQTKDVPALVGYDNETYEEFVGDDVNAGCHTPKKKRSVRRQRADGFTPPKKTETKPDTSDPKIKDLAEDSDRKKELDKTTGYAFKDEARKRQASITLESEDFGTYLVINNITGEDILIQDESDIEGVAGTFGWPGPMQGSPVDWLDSHIGEAVEDPGYFNDPGDEVDAAYDRLRDARKRQAGPKLREKWDDGGGYNRDMEAESAEELYHLVRSFGSDDDYDWSSYKPNMPIAPEGIEEGNAAGEKFEGPEVMGTEARRYANEGLTSPDELYQQIIDAGVPTDKHESDLYFLVTPETQEIVDNYEFRTSVTTFRSEGEMWFEAPFMLMGGHSANVANKKKAVDDAAKEYWKNYYGDYGKALVDEGNIGGSPRSRKKEKKDKADDKDTKKEARRSIRSRVKANIRRRDANKRRMAQQSQNPNVQPAGQNALDGAPLADTSDLGGPPATGLAPTTPQAPDVSKPNGEQLPPGTGDSGLQALGWLPEDIQVMTADDKQKILQVRLNKPGTKAPKSSETPEASPTGAPPAGGKDVPATTPAMPAEQPAQLEAPTPIQARLIARRLDQKLKVRRAQQVLENAPQVEPIQPDVAPQVDPNTAPVEAPMAPVEAPIADTGSGSLEEQAFGILQEVRRQEVNATDSTGIAIQKNQLLAQRLMTELGMSMEEAKKLYGVKNTSKLFQ